MLTTNERLARGHCLCLTRDCAGLGQISAVTGLLSYVRIGQLKFPRHECPRIDDGADNFGNADIPHSGTLACRT